MMMTGGSSSNAILITTNNDTAGCLSLPTQQFNLPADVKHLFAVEVLLDHPKATKDHVACNAGDILFVLLIAHEKMAGDRYLEGGTDGLTDRMTDRHTE